MSFDAADPGTPEAAWRDAGYRERLPQLDIGPLRRLLVVAAHPDDETLMAGGIIATAGARGLPVVVVVASSGEASHPRSATWTGAALADAREREVREAVARLAPQADVRLLRLPDGRLTEHRDRLGDAIRGLAAEPGTAVVSTWRDDGHPDHTAVALAAADAATAAGALHLEAPVWGWHRDEPGSAAWPPAVRLDLDDDAVTAKRAAILLHRTQIEALSAAPGDEVLLHGGMLDHFRTAGEVFFPGGAVQAVDFDAMYAVADDPWGFDDRWYEQRKRDILLASLPRPRFERVLEIGCSIGTLTAALADRADAVLATDVADRAVQQARARLRDRPHVAVEQRRLPEEWPDGAFDLIVLSEVGFYLAGAALEEVADRSRESLAPGGVFVACHWRPHVLGLDRGGDEVHRVLRARLGATGTVLHREDDFVLEVLQRDPVQSVAQAGGLR